MKLPQVTLTIETPEMRRDFPLCVAGVKDAINYYDALGGTATVLIDGEPATAFLEDVALGFSSGLPGRVAETADWVEQVAFYLMKRKGAL
jgi:hypothetical protein